MNQRDATDLDEISRLDDWPLLDSLSALDAGWVEVDVVSADGGDGDADSVVQFGAVLDSLQPGAVLGLVLSGIDVDRLSGWERVVVLRAQQRLLSHVQALVYRSLAAVVDWMAEWKTFGDDRVVAEAADGAAAEVQAALRWTRRVAEQEMWWALELCRRLPVVWGALAAGVIDVRRAKVIGHGTVHLDDEDARAVAEAIVAEAGQLTSGRLVGRVRRLCIEANPQDAAARCEAAVGQRRVVCEGTPSGSANLLGLDLAPDDAAAVKRRIDGIAREMKTAGESRTTNQLRADVFVDLLRGVDHRAGVGGRWIWWSMSPRWRVCLRRRVRLAGWGR